MPYDARVIANCFLTSANRDGIPIFPVKMQKLVYLAHGWSLAFRGQPLITDEVQAWKYGPVVPAVYRAFKQYSGSAIQAPAQVPTRMANSQIDEESRELIGTVWDRYGSLSATQLSALTHEPGFAWDLTMKSSGHGLLAQFSTPVIKNALIADEFQRRRNQAVHQAPNA